MVQFTGASAKWKFSITHTNVLYESPHGSAAEHTSFVNTVVGGDISCPQFTGVATSDQAFIPNPVSI